MMDRTDRAIVDHVPNNAPGPQEVGFNIPQRYNASEILFNNLQAGRTDKVAIYAADGNTSYGELCAKAAKAGNALKSLGLALGDRVLLLQNDTTAYPAVLFGAIRAGRRSARMRRSISSCNRSSLMQPKPRVAVSSLS